MRLGFNTARIANGMLTATLDRIDPGAKDVLISAIAESAEIVTFEESIVGGTFAGKFSADSSEIDGTWSEANNRSHSFSNEWRNNRKTGSD